MTLTRIWKVLFFSIWTLGAGGLAYLIWVWGITLPLPPHPGGP